MKMEWNKIVEYTAITNLNCFLFLAMLVLKSSQTLFYNLRAYYSFMVLRRKQNEFQK
jgi:hypothetical protein